MCLLSSLTFSQVLQNEPNINPTPDNEINSLQLTDLKVYPNPTSEKVLVRVVSELDQEVTLTLVDEKGETVSSQSQALKEGLNYIPVRLESSGLYLLRINTRSGVISRRIVSQ